MAVDTPTVPSDLASALASRYNLRSLLGRGGMATVYLADDLKHHRQVAVKVLQADLAATVGADRFLTEIRIVAQLTHPHILALHDSGEAGGFIYYVMPHISGGSLRQRLERDGPWTSPRALAIAGPVADALTYAHRMGMLHRDIKPENILFSQGHPIVADFGIASAVSAATGPAPHSHRAGARHAGLHESGAGRGRGRPRRAHRRVRPRGGDLRDAGGRSPPGVAHRGRGADGPLHRSAGRRTAPGWPSVGAVAEGALVRGLAVRPSQRTPNPETLMAELSGRQKPRRVYHADEVNAIVRKAAELEATNPTSAGAMTIGGVEALAAEVGIKPDLVRSAAGSLSRRTSAGAGFVPLRPQPDSVLAGGPTRLHYERVIEGELLEEDFPVVLDEVRRAMGSAGKVSQMGKSFTWEPTSSDLSRLLEITVTVRSGRTRLTVQENLGRLLGVVYGAIGGGVGGGGFGLIAAIVAGGSNAPYLLPILLPAWILAIYGGSRLAYRYNSHKRRGDLDELADHLALVIKDLIDGS